uniref:Carrier domain-containing protein n=1 Tax=Triticum urartu TaxID=4572 RepID=A0A8R7QAC4_TRIUA
MAHCLAAVASFSPSAVRRRLSSQVANVISSRSSVSFRSQKMSFVSISSRPSSLRFKICCSATGETQAKKETVDKVCMIVKKQLAVPDGTPVTAESKFSELGADSLDTVNPQLPIPQKWQ